MTDNHFVKVKPWVSRGGLLDPYAKAVYINLLSRQGANKHAWPSHKKIANETCMSVTRVKTAIKKLSDLGVLEVKGRVGKHGGQSSNSYRVKDLPGLRAPTPQASEDYEGDSTQEDSTLNSSSQMSERVWNPSDEHPPTEAQRKYLAALIAEVEGIEIDEAWDVIEDTDIQTAADADYEIKTVFSELQGLRFRGET